ncbi:hypothetical protein GEMRC1_013751 [Eukaryota sp. GEM-RC1]
MFYRSLNAFFNNSNSKDGLCLSSLPPVKHNDSVDVVGPHFSTYWATELQSSRSASLIRALWRSFRDPILFLAVGVIAKDLLSFAYPYLLSLLLKRVEDGASFQYAFSVLASIILILVIQQVFANFLHLRTTSLSLRLRVALSTVICKSFMLIKPSARATIGSGKALNAISNDSMVIARVIRDCYTLVSIPFKILLSFVYLTVLLGIEAAALTVAVFVVFFPLSYIISTSLVKARREMKKESDVRISFSVECIRGIKTIKLGFLESFIKKRVFWLRDKELVFLKKVKVFRAMKSLLFQSIPVVMKLVFISYTAVFNKDKFTPSIIITSLSLISTLNRPLSQLPMKLSKLLDAKVSLNRLYSVLLADKVDDVGEAQEGMVLKIFKNSKFSWAESGASFGLYFNDFSISIPLGSLFVLEGPVAAGKSSFFSAILGEMHQVSGSLLKRSKMAFVGQVPFILPQTVRENIVMFNEFKEDVYGKVLHATSLLPDLAVMLDHDLALIGDEGLNLSGGQKYRIALARALYHVIVNDDVMFLSVDDPFASVDATTAQHISNHLIPMVLKLNKSILISTHQKNFIDNHNHTVISLSNGAVVNVIEVNNSSDDVSDLCDSDVQLGFSIRHSSELCGLGAEIDNESGKEHEISSKIYKKLLVALGGFKSFFIISDYSLASWLSSTLLSNTGRNLLVFSGSQVLAICFTAYSVLFLSFAVVRASRVLHCELVNGIFDTYLTFFETTSTGRITNRITHDLANLDAKVQMSLLKVLRIYTNFFGNALALMFIVPFVFVPFTLLSFIYIKLQKQFSGVFVHVKRIVSSTQSPIFQMLQQILNGSSVLRALNFDQQFVSNKRFDLYSSAMYFEALLHCWLSIRLCLLGLFIVASAGSFSLYMNLSAAFVGLSLNYAITISASVQTLIEAMVGFKGSLSCVERLCEFIELPREIEVIVDKTEVDVDHSVEFRGVSARYGKDLPLVLDDVSLIAHQGQRTALIGATGSGKSSCFNVLLGLLKLESGDVLIGGRSITELPLSVLRQMIAIIPQSPTIFSFSIRFNLDPSQSLPDDQVQAAFSAAYLDLFSVDGDQPLTFRY